MSENISGDGFNREQNGASSNSFISHNRMIITAIVYVALLLDNVLLTVIVPILPDYLATLDSKMQIIPHHLKVFSNLFPYENLPLSIMKHPIPSVEENIIIAPAFVTMSSSDGQDSVVINKDSLASENRSIGFLLAMKALMQLIFNPIVGNMSSKFGYRLPIVFGTLCLLLSAIVFAIGETYVTLLIARAVHGIGSACIGVCGMSLVAQLYPEEERRSKVMGIILGSIALGVLIGYPFGGILYDLAGKSTPFIILSSVIFFNLGMQLLAIDLSVQPEVTIENEPKPKWKPLLKNKMILAIVIAIWFSTSTMAILEPCLPIWLIQNLKPKKWQLGSVFIPDSLGYFIGANFFGTIAYKKGQILISCLSLLLVGISSIMIPNAITVPQLLMPHFGLGLGIGIIDASLVPLLATYVDASLNEDSSAQGAQGSDSMSSYGTVYAIQQTSVSLAYCLAPLLGGELAQVLGFPWLMRVVGILNIIYGPILVFLNHKFNPMDAIEKRSQLLLTNSGGSGANYKKLYNTLDME